MIRLDTTTRKLQVVLAGAVTTNQLPVVVCWSDKTSSDYVGGATPSNTNGAAAVDVCAAPASGAVRDIDSITAYNSDTAPATVTLLYNDNGTAYSLFKATLAAGDQLIYTHGQGWKVLDSTGLTKVSAATDLATLTGTQTLTNKTIALGSNTISGTKAQFDAACSDGDFAYLAQSNTFTAAQYVNVTDNTNPALKITQAGTGDCFVVEDVASDTTPFTIGNGGNIGVGIAASPFVSMYMSRPLTGATTVYSRLTIGAAQPDSTTAVYDDLSQLSTAGNGGTPYVIGNITHKSVNQGTLHADSSVTTQIGYYAGASLTGAATNYAFFSAIAAGANRWAFYGSGTAPSYSNGDIRSNTVVSQSTSPTNSNATATATASSLLGGLRTGTPTAAIDLQLPTGTNMDAAFTSLQANQSFVWSVLNLAATTYTITVTANTDHTVVGGMAITAATSGRFLTRKTATNTFITYRVS
jgi:hypothetical protein